MKSSADFTHFLQIASGSANETEYLILLCRVLNYIGLNQSTELHGKITTIKKMFNGLKRNLKPIHVNSMQDFKKLQVWTKSHEMTLRIYELSCQFPSEERYGVTSQIRRATASIPTNIAEGCGRESSADFARFLQIASGSANETEYLILL